MKEFKQHQKDAVIAKMNNLSCTVFVSYDDGGSWFAKSNSGKSVDVMDGFISFDTSVLYVAVSKENLETATACLIDDKTVESTYRGERLTISKKSVFDKREHWLAFYDGVLEIKKEPIVVWVAATIDTCSKPHSSCAELAKKLSLKHDGEIRDGQAIDGFTFNMIKVEL